MIPGSNAVLLFHPWNQARPADAPTAVRQQMNVACKQH
jgi:hypothetical protein